MPTSGAGRRRAYFHLQLAANRLRVLADRECRRVSGVTGAQAGALYAIAAAPGGTQRALADTLRLGESAINGMVARLIEQDLVARRRETGDSRAWRLDLTAKGHRTLVSVDRALASLNGAIDTALDGIDLDVVVDGLEALEIVDGPDVDSVSPSP